MAFEIACYVILGLILLGVVDRVVGGFLFSVERHVLMSTAGKLQALAAELNMDLRAEASCIVCYENGRRTWTKSPADALQFLRALKKANS